MVIWVNTCVFPTSHPGYALYNLFPHWNTLLKWLSQHDIASYTAKRHQLICWQASISVNWAVGGVCKVLSLLVLEQNALLIHRKGRQGPKRQNIVEEVYLLWTTKQEIFEGNEISLRILIKICISHVLNSYEEKHFFPFQYKNKQKTIPTMLVDIIKVDIKSKGKEHLTSWEEELEMFVASVTSSHHRIYKKHTWLGRVTNCATSSQTEPIFRNPCVISTSQVKIKWMHRF